MAKKILKKIITGTPRYYQDYLTNSKGQEVMAGCGPVALAILSAFYDRRYGYELIPKKFESKEFPEELLLSLYDILKTKNFEVGKENRKNQDYGLTLPSDFKAGVKKWFKKKGYEVDVDTKSSTGVGTVEKVFEKSVELIKSNKIHFLLFDWDGDGLIFPNHFVVVVGYNCEDSRMELIVNNGWGDDFQIIDMSDKKVKPIRIYWLKNADEPEGKADGHKIGPCDGYDWKKDSNGKGQLKPTFYRHFSRSKTVSWRPSDSAKFLVNGTEIRFCEWFD